MKLFKRNAKEAVIETIQIAAIVVVVMYVAALMAVAIINTINSF